MDTPKEPTKQVPKKSGANTWLPYMRPLTSLKAGLIIGALALLLIGFIGGQAFEREHMRYLVRWRDNYQHNFFPQHSMRPSSRPPHQELRSLHAHALLGTVIATDNNQLTIKDRDNTEAFVTIDEQTVIREGNTSRAASDIKVDQKLAVFGEPTSDGHINARLIRILEPNANPIP